MHNGLKIIFAFSLGAAIGAVVTHQVLKPKYEKMVQDEVNAFKQDWSNREGESVTCPLDDDRDTYSIPELSGLAKENSELIEDLGYATTEKKGGSKSMSNDDPYVISPLLFAEGCDYDTVSLTYYSDGILTDDMNEPIEDIAGTVGLDFHEHFGEYTEDPDTVYVRNDRLETDYEIQLDLGTYADAKKRLLNPTDDE
jgi:hypothetical protein